MPVQEWSVKIDDVVWLGALIAILIFAYGTTLIDYSPRYASLCLLGAVLLIAGHTLRSLLGVSVTVEHKVQVNAIIITTALVFAVQLPFVLAGLRIYKLAVAQELYVLFVVAMGAAEEAFFGLCLYGWMRKTTQSPGIANLACATVFTAFHYAVYAITPVALFAVFASRLVLNYAIEKHGVGVSTGAHMLVNLLASL